VANGTEIFVHDSIYYFKYYALHFDYNVKLISRVIQITIIIITEREF
jgi:hypothetical protein